jgi:hypothetical protein
VVTSPAAPGIFAINAKYYRGECFEIFTSFVTSVLQNDQRSIKSKFLLLIVPLLTLYLHQRSVDSIQPYSRGVKRTWSSQFVSGSAVRVAACALVSERTRELSSESVCPYESRFSFL